MKENIVIKEEDVKMQGTDRTLFAVTQKAVVYRSDTEEFLILKDSGNENRSSIKVLGEWQLAGGHMDHEDKSTVEGLEREVAEELGEHFVCSVGEIFHSLRADYGKYARVMNCYFAQYVSGDITLNDEHVEYRWVSADNVRENDDYTDFLQQIILKAQEYVVQKEAHDKMLRTLAEFDNYKKRSAERQKDFAKYASEKVIMEMLPVLDNFHAATGFVPNDRKDSPWLTGIMFIQQQMEKVFEDAGVHAIDISVGDAFDAQKMEALQSTEKKSGNRAHEDDSDEKIDTENASTVVKVVQKGYMIGDKVMRPARVEVT